MRIRFTLYAGILPFLASTIFASCFGDRELHDTQKEEIVKVEVGTPTPQVRDEISVSGRIESQETAVISTRLMGFISKINVSPGSKVQKGQRLVTIANDDVLAKHAQAEAGVTEAEAALYDARNDYERFKDLYSQESASAKEFENATLRYNSMKAKAQGAHQMKKEVEAMLTYANIVAPFSGVITQKYADQGSMSIPGSPLLVMERSDAYQVRASVSEREISALKIGTEVQVFIKSTGKKISGTVSEISPSSHFTGGQYEIKVSVPIMANAELFSGMFVSVSFTSGNSGTDPGIFVPVSSIIHRDQLTGLYTVAPDNTAQLRWLKLGKQIGDHVEVLSGIHALERFVTQSNGKLYSGAHLSITN